MTSIFNLFVIIPVINILLLAINFILAPHKPYKEKKTPFECGYHSFLAQNRTQFTISFFLFGILFLLFDIEIVIIYPITVSSYFNAGYGIFVVILFVLVLALGFVFELGKGALKIETKQSHMHLHSSCFIAIPYITDVIKQIIHSLYDFFTKNLNAHYVYFRLICSVIFNVFIIIISFAVCSPYTLNFINYSTLYSCLTLLIFALYFYGIFSNSDEFNWAYNTVQLILGLFLILIFWACVKLSVNCAYESIVFFTSSVLSLDNILKMEGGGTDPSGNPGSPGNSDLPKPPKPPNTFIKLSGIPDNPDSEDSIERKHLTKEDMAKTPVDSTRLGELKNDIEVNAAVTSDRTNTSVPSPYFDTYVNSSLSTIITQSVQESDSPEAAKDMAASNMAPRFDMAERREAIVIEKISYAKHIISEDKEMLRERAHARYIEEKYFHTKFANGSFYIKCSNKFPFYKHSNTTWTPQSGKIQTNPFSSR